MSLKNDFIEVEARQCSSIRRGLTLWASDTLSSTLFFKLSYITFDTSLPI